MAPRCRRVGAVHSIKREYSLRVDVVRSCPNNRHAATARSCPFGAHFGRSSRMTSATPVAGISRYRRNALIRYGNRAAIFSELTEPRKPEVCGGGTRHGTHM